MPQIERAQLVIVQDHPEETASLSNLTAQRHRLNLPWGRSVSGAATVTALKRVMMSDKAG
jgi:hypothetical protein